MSEAEKQVPSYVGKSRLHLVPTDDNILLAGKVRLSLLSFSKDKPDEQETFKFYVIGFGNKVEDLNFDDEVKTMPNMAGMVNIPNNFRSFAKLSTMIRRLNPKEYKDYADSLVADEDGIKRIEITEYFLIKRYAILGVYTDDPARNAIKDEESNANDTTNN